MRYKVLKDFPDTSSAGNYYVAGDTFESRHNNITNFLVKYGWIEQENIVISSKQETREMVLFLIGLVSGVWITFVMLWFTGHVVHLTDDVQSMQWPHQTCGQYHYGYDCK